MKIGIEFEVRVFDSVDGYPYVQRVLVDPADVFAVEEDQDRTRIRVRGVEEPYTVKLPYDRVIEKLRAYGEEAHRFGSAEVVETPPASAELGIYPPAPRRKTGFSTPRTDRIAELKKQHEKLHRLYLDTLVREARLRGAVRAVLEHRAGSLPSLGYLRDNDSSRAALERLQSVYDEPVRSTISK